MSKVVSSKCGEMKEGLITEDEVVEVEKIGGKSDDYGDACNDRVSCLCILSPQHVESAIEDEDVRGARVRPKCACARS